MEPVIANPDFSDPRFVLHKILLVLDIEGFRKFIEEHPKEFEGLGKDHNDAFFLGILHLYRAHLPYFGEDHVTSINYCLEKGILNKCGANASTQKEPGTNCVLEKPQE